MLAINAALHALVNVGRSEQKEANQREHGG